MNPKDRDRQPKDAKDSEYAGPLVWHPAIRAILWLKDWIFFALCTAVIWEFLMTGGFRLFEASETTLVLTVWIIAALLLISVLILPLELWWQLVGHARREYDQSVASRIVAVESALILVLVLLYLWFVTWVLGYAWEFLLGSGDHFAAATMKPKTSTTWTTAILLTLLTGVLVWIVWKLLYASVSKYLLSLRMFGILKVLKGILIMVLLRLRQPRKDFFIQAPLISYMPWLAVCVALYASIPFAVFNYLIPMMLLGGIVAHGLDMVTPPMWLFLGSSTQESFRVFHNVRRIWRWRTGVTLIDREGNEGSTYYYAEAAYRVQQGSVAHRFFTNPATPRAWSLRTRGELWEQTVLLLIDYVPVIIVDVRAGSYPVEKELAWLATPERLDKAWFLGTDEGFAPAINEIMTKLTKEQQALLKSQINRVIAESDFYTAEWDKNGLQIEAKHAGG